MDEKRYKIASGIEYFEDTNIMIHDENFCMSRKQICELFDTSERKVTYAVKLLSERGYHFSSNMVENNSVGRKATYFRLESVVAIGMNINSNRAYRFQDWSYRQLTKLIVDKSKESQRLRIDNYHLCVGNAKLRKQLDLLY
jgi:hypothetical protein